MERPCFLGGTRQHRLSDSATREAVRETEVRNLDRAVVASHELEEAGTVVADEALPDSNIWARQIGAELVVGPRVAIVPMPASTYVVIQPTVVRGGDRGTTDESDAGIPSARRAKLLWGAKLEIGSNDFDGAMQCAVSAP